MHESFKIGDKVLCEGKLGRIVADLPHQVATDRGANVRFDEGWSTWNWAKNIEHVSDVESNKGFAIGDEVYVDFEPFFEPNMIYTISFVGDFAIGFEGTNMVADPSQLTHAIKEEESKDISNVSVRVGIEGGEKFKSLADSVSELNDKVEIISNLIVELKEATRAVSNELAEAIVVEPVEETEQETKLSREEVVQKAKRFVDNKRDCDGDIKVGIHYVTPEFFVNAEKRTVVVILRLWTDESQIIAKGKETACGDDVFNAHIGKAIALARAVGEEVPEEFINAPQPERAEVGMCVRLNRGGDLYKLADRIPDFDGAGYGRAFRLGELSGLWSGENQFTIVDDTHVGGK